MSLSDVKVIKGNGGLGRRNPVADGVVGLISTGVAVASKLVLGTTYKLQGIADAVAIGIDSAYDTTNDVLVFATLAELFRINPSATVYLMLAPKTTAMADLADPTKAFAPKLITDSDNSIVQLGICLNPDDEYVAVLADGLDDQVFEAVAQAQLLAVYADGIHAPISAIIIEGLQFNGTAALAKDLRTLASNKVSVVIAQDASSAGATSNINHASVGAVLGMISLANVHENIGWPEKFPLTDTLNKKWLKPGLSGGIALSSFTVAQLNVLDDKGYIFARTVPQLAGLYFNNSYTCTTLDDDYGNIELNRTMDKAIKQVRGALVPKLNSPLYVDSTTGFLQPVTIADFETLAQSKLDEMLRNREISSGSVYINPEQNVLSTSELGVEVEIVPTGTAKTISVKIAFNNPFNK